MLRRGGQGIGVVVRYVVLDEATVLNASQTAEHAADDVQEGLGGVGGLVHARDGASPMRRCTDFRSTERAPRVPSHWTAHEVAQLRALLADENVETLAIALGVHRSRAARFLNGDLAWTDYQRAKLARGRAA